jgi:hypothetical protein
MTPKEKAKELFLKFRQIPPSSPYTGVDDGEAKQCSLIAVDVILIDCGAKDWSGDEACEGKNYWEEVKKQIEKL